VGGAGGGGPRPRRAAAPLDPESIASASSACRRFERQFKRRVRLRASRAPRRIVFPEGGHDKILRACHIVHEERIARPVLLGDPALIRLKIGDLGITIPDVEIIDPTDPGAQDGYLARLLELRGRGGVAAVEGQAMIEDPTMFGLLMLEKGDVDGFVGGIDRHYPETLRPALSLVRTRETVNRACGIYVLMFANELLFLADTTVNIDPTAEALAEIAILTAQVARRFEVEPRVALLVLELRLGRSSADPQDGRPSRSCTGSSPPSWWMARCRRRPRSIRVPRRGVSWSNLRGRANAGLPRPAGGHRLPAADGAGRGRGGRADPRRDAPSGARADGVRRG
jgi:hypothetical protein